MRALLGWLLHACGTAPYASFLVAHLGTDSSRRSATEVKGSVAQVSIHRLTGMA